MQVGRVIIRLTVWAQKTNSGVKNDHVSYRNIRNKRLKFPDSLEIDLDFSEVLTVSCGVLISKFEKQITDKFMEDDGNINCEKLFSGKPTYRLLLGSGCSKSLLVVCWFK